MDYQLGTRVLMKKAHPCGGQEFIITRIGADIKIQCAKCNRIIMLDRNVFEKKLKKIIIE